MDKGPETEDIEKGLWFIESMVNPAFSGKPLNREIGELSDKAESIKAGKIKSYKTEKLIENVIFYLASKPSCLINLQPISRG